MPLYPGATYEPIAGHTDGFFQRPILGIVLHVNDGSPSPDDSNTDLAPYIERTPTAACPHFQVGKAGHVWQYLDTHQTSWCQSDGNAQYLSIETQGLPMEAATDAQVIAVAGILAWVHTTHGVTLALSNAPGQPGFGWHGMGGAAWGGHPDCPGVRRDQRSAMLDLASATFSGGGTPITPEATMARPIISAYQNAEWMVAADLTSRVWIRDNVNVYVNDTANYVDRDLPAEQMAIIPVVGAAPPLTTTP